MSRIFLCGDIHGHIDICTLNSKNFPVGKTLTKDDYVICLGDFGIPWDKNISKQDKNLLDWLHNKPWTTLVVDGNHCNHEYLAGIDTIDMFGQDVGKIYDSVYHLRRGRVYTIHGKTFFTMGGAESIDKHLRTIGISWWKEEIPSYEEFERGYSSLDSCGWSVDYILTHTMPKRTIQEFKSHQIEQFVEQFKHRAVLGDKIKTQYINDDYFEDKKDAVSEYLDDLIFEKNLSFKKHFFGHFHDNWISKDGKHQLIYRSVVELNE